MFVDICQNLAKNIEPPSENVTVENYQGNCNTQSIENIYLNDNKCNTLAEDGDIKKIWSGYYSQMLNKTNRKSNYTVARKLKEKYLRYP